MHTDDDELIAIAKLLETAEAQADEARAAGDPAVSYTHLTLPTSDLV